MYREGRPVIYSILINSTETRRADSPMRMWCKWWDSNPRPLPYQGSALPAEPHLHGSGIIKARTHQVNMQRQIPRLPFDQLIDQLDQYDALIDVRAPAEFLEDHIPGAINLPVLSDAEREEVGTLYKQVNPFTARKRGAALTAQNIARHLETLSDHDKDWTPLIYCWRGGQRSGSMALVFNEIGWPVTLIQGGYKAYRRHVITALETLSTAFEFRVLTGPTGAGKTRLLHGLQARGAQILDLEGLANHRGSLLGEAPQSDQPKQKLFESRLYAALRMFDRKEPVWIESESSKIGEIHLPNQLFKHLMQSKGVRVDCSRARRAEYLCQDYQHLTDNPDKTHALIEKLTFRHSRGQVDAWRQLIDDRAWLQLADSLLEVHYDPAYAQSQKRLQVIADCTLEHPGELSDAVFNQLMDAS